METDSEKRTEHSASAATTQQPPAPSRKIESSGYSKESVKDIREGIMRGVATASRGVITGVRALVSSPLEGAKESGAMGFLRGTMKGIEGMARHSFEGMYEGSVLITKGVKSTGSDLLSVASTFTKKSEQEVAADKSEILSDEKAIVQYDTAYAEMRKTILEMQSRRGDNIHRSKSTSKLTSTSSPHRTGAATLPETEAPKNAVKDTELYSSLGVTPFASESEIRKAYYKLAKDLHPDRNPGDEEKENEFVRVGRAYQILSCRSKREQYDRFGNAILEDDFMDPRVFYTMAFGGDRFKPWVGELTVAFLASAEPTEEEVAAFQKKREAELQILLNERLRDWVNGEEDKFIQSIVAEAMELKSQKFGLEMLSTIGYTYFHKASILLGLHPTFTLSSSAVDGVRGFFLSIKEHAHIWKSNIKAAKAEIKLQDLTKKMDGAELCEETLEDYLESVWQVSILDIESTLRQVVKRVLMESGVSKDIRHRRAKGIMRLGRIFKEIAKSAGVEPVTSTIPCPLEESSSFAAEGAQ